MRQIFVLPPHVIRCCQSLRQAGFSAHPVGGCVRDLLLGRTPADWDICTSAPPETVCTVFPQAVLTSAHYGTVTVYTGSGPLEVTTFRREGSYSDGRHPDVVSFVPSLEEDLRRRDFTVNAMALDHSGQVLDLFGGQDDLRLGRLRCVGCPDLRFREDRLRMFRALRFSAQLGFRPDQAMWTALERYGHTAGMLPIERVRPEVEKTLLSPRPQWVEPMLSLGLLAPWLGCAPGIDTSHLSLLPPDPLPRWAGLLALLPDAQSFLLRLSLPRRLARPLQKGLLLFQSGLPQTDVQWRQALARYGLDGCQAAAAMGGSRPQTRLTAVLGSRPCLTVRDLALSGADLAALGLSGADIGAAQAMLLSHVLEYPEDNVPQRLLSLL